jgi:hypothetical protein
MKKVICINDKDLPLGAHVVEGKEYEVEYEYINGYEQRAFILKGAINEGNTKWGVHWVGYNARRFAVLDNLEIKEEEHMFALN